MIAIVEISSDKVLGHLFTDFMSLGTHEVPPLLASSAEILQVRPV